MYDFPLGGDNFWWLVMRVMALFTSDWALLVNLFYLLGFFAVPGRARSSPALVRRTPCHVARGRCALCVRAVPLHPLRPSRVRVVCGPADRRRARRARRAGATRCPVSAPPLHADGCRSSAGWSLTALVGSCNSYYAVFSVIIIVNGRARVERRGADVAAPARRRHDHRAHRLGAGREPAALDAAQPQERQQRTGRRAAGAEVDIYGLRFDPNPDADSRTSARALARRCPTTCRRRRTTRSRRCSWVWSPASGSSA